tara:strand:- start:9067 stop:9360 length:294 start_codon:yes stop_codon:yes gene_type:complete
MSVDHASGTAAPAEARPEFLDVRRGDFVIVQEQQTVAQAKTDGWWMGHVIWIDGGARNPDINSMFQIADVDDGAIRWVNGDEVLKVLHCLDGLNDSL